MTPLGAKPVFCVLGVGNAGLALAGDLARKGYEVRLYDPAPKTQERYRQQGKGQGDAEIRVATTDIAQAMEGASILLVTVPASELAQMAQRCAPYLRPDQMILLAQGGFGGTLEFHHILREHGIRESILLTETQTPLHDCRPIHAEQTHLSGIRRGVPLAALPARRVSGALAALRPAFPELVESESVLQIGLDQIAPVFYPAACVLDTRRLERAPDASEPARVRIGRRATQVLHALDAERLAVGRELGLHSFSAREWLYLACGASGRTLHQALQSHLDGMGGKVPYTLQRRLSNDVPVGLVPLASLGEALGVPCPTMRAIIHLAGLLHGCDYWQEGRTLRRMGLEGLSAAQIRQLAHDGGPTAERRDTVFCGRESVPKPWRARVSGIEQP